jgi:hypothetical protein
MFFRISHRLDKQLGPETYNFFSIQKYKTYMTGRTDLCYRCSLQRVWAKCDKRTYEGRGPWTRPLVGLLCNSGAANAQRRRCIDALV